MKGFIRFVAAGLVLGTGIITLAGCHSYRRMVDPCWPERYNAEARHSVRETFAAQVNNGHILDQTIWNYHFEVDPKTGEPTDKLNAGGMEHLRSLTRRGPVPDTHLYLQTAQVVSGAEKMAPEALGQARSDLDNRRVASIQKYMAGVMSGRSQALEFDIAVTDPSPVGIAALPIAGSQKTAVVGVMPILHNNFKGKMPGVEGVTITTTGGQ